MTGYIKYLREYVGHAPLLMCGACVIIENPEGEILLQLRADNHCWGIAGGAVELGESTEEAARRELLEETGLVADELELFSVFSGKNQHYIYPNGDEVHVVDVVYSCKRYHGSMERQAEEVDELRFFPLDAIPENLSPPQRDSIEKYAAMRRKKGGTYGF